MEWYWTGSILMGVLLAMMAAGVPVAFAFLAADLVGVFIFMGGAAGLAQVVANSTTSITLFTLVPVPLFILMGELFYHTELASKVFNVLDRVLGRIAGRLSYVTVFGGTLFATLSGSSLANTAMLGSTMIPDMQARGYKRHMAIGPILGTGGLAMIIPPSTLAVLLGSIGHIDVGGLLIGGVVPGIILAGFYLITIFIRVRLDRDAAPSYAVENASKREALMLVARDILPMGIVIIAVIGAILAGVATPTEASALGVCAVFFLILVYRKFSWDSMRKAINGTANISAMTLLIIIGSSTFSQLLAFSGVTSGLLDWALGVNIGAMTTFAIMFLVILVLGAFMDQVSIMLITLPVFMPIVHSLGFDPVWFGITMLIGLEIGLISPPFGMSLFVMKGVAPPDTTYGEIVKAGLPFILCALLVVGLLTLFPALVTWLPSMANP